MSDNTPSIIVLGFETKISNGKEVDYVTYGPTYDLDKTKVVARVSEVMFDPAKFDEGGNNMKRDFIKHRWSMIEPAYREWKDGNALPETGTPLISWAGVNKAQVEALKSAHIKTVEQLAGLPDGNMEKMRVPGLRVLREQAQAFLSSAKSDSKLNDVIKENADLRDRLDAAMEMLEKLAADKDEQKGGKSKAEAA